jgi:lipopolysaccharide/colanic/teichoic acid biosynthesis glycosyltransferase
MASLDNIQDLTTSFGPLAILPAEVTSASQRSSVYFIAKRIIDIVFGVSFLIVSFPVMAVIAVLIRLDSAGPAIFTQERVGAKRVAGSRGTMWETRTFRFYKFRSMIRNADQSLHVQCVRELYEQQGPVGKFKLSDDGRITRVGRFLRKSSLDELPQLFNVLRGDMSLVGPRPVPVYEAALYQGPHRERLTATPGITGPWQATARCRVPVDEMIRMDIEYARHQSLWLDLKILLQTIPAVLSGQGAD